VRGRVVVASGGPSRNPRPDRQRPELSLPAMRPAGKTASASACTHTHLPPRRVPLVSFPRRMGGHQPHGMAWRGLSAWPRTWMGEEGMR
jgi:hypothetical protein